MKRNLLFLVFGLVILASCSSSEQKVVGTSKDLTIEVTKDTVVSKMMPVTAPRYSCSGTVLSDPKLIGMSRTTSPAHFAWNETIPASTLRKHGYVYVGDQSSIQPVQNDLVQPIQNASYFGFRGDWSDWLLVLLILTLLFSLIAITVALLRNREPHTCHHSVTISNPPAQNPPPSNTEGNDLKALIDAVQKSGGTMKIEINIPNQPAPPKEDEANK